MMRLLKSLTKHKLFAALCCGLAFTLAIGSFRDFDRTCTALRQDVIRLHVMANSDSPADQTLKLQVRDTVLDRVETLCKSFAAESKAQVETLLTENREMLEQAAQETVFQAGYIYPVSVAVTETYFATRDYDRFTLPAGRYASLQVEIGAAKGKNWWCVAFPPLCMPAGGEEALASFSPDETEIITHPKKYQVKFAVVELVERIKEKWKR